MKRTIIYIAVVISIVAFITPWNSSTIDIHLHDMYLVIDKLTYIFLAITFFGTIFSFLEVIISKGRNKVALIVLAFFAAIDIYYLISFSKVITAA